MEIQQPTQNKPQTPLEKLLSDKEQLYRRCAQQQKKLNDDFLYIQENVAGVFLHGFTSLLFPGTTQKKATSSDAIAATNNRLSTSIDYLDLIRELSPIAWDVVKPLLLTWGIKKIQSWFTGLLSQKRDRT